VGADETRLRKLVAAATETVALLQREVEEDPFVPEELAALSEDVRARLPRLKPEGYFFDIERNRLQLIYY
jgi:FtsZ-binding cell division protein ZapB